MSNPNQGMQWQPSNPSMGHPHPGPAHPGQGYGQFPGQPFTQQPSPRRSPRTPLVIGTVTVLVAIGAAIAVYSTRGDDQGGATPSSQTSQSTTPSPSSSDTPSPTPSDTPPKGKAPGDPGKWKDVSVKKVHSPTKFGDGWTTPGSSKPAGNMFVIYLHSQSNKNIVTTVMPLPGSMQESRDKLGSPLVAGDAVCGDSESSKPDNPTSSCYIELSDGYVLGSSSLSPKDAGEVFTAWLKEATK